MSETRRGAAGTHGLRVFGPRSHYIATARLAVDTAWASSSRSAWSSSWSLCRPKQRTWPTPQGQHTTCWMLICEHSGPLLLGTSGVAGPLAAQGGGQICRPFVLGFYAPQLVPPGTAEARISYGIFVCLSVTTRYRFNARGDRDSGSSPYGSLEYLVSYELIWCQWVKRFPANEGIKEGYPP